MFRVIIGDSQPDILETCRISLSTLKDSTDGRDAKMLSAPKICCLVTSTLFHKLNMSCILIEMSFLTTSSILVEF